MKAHHTQTHAPLRGHASLLRSRWKVQHGSSPPGRWWMRVGGLDLVSQVFLFFFFLVCGPLWKLWEEEGECPTGGLLFLRESVGTKVPPNHRAAASGIHTLLKTSYGRKDAPICPLVSPENTHVPPLWTPGLRPEDPTENSRPAIVYPTSWPGVGHWALGDSPSPQQPEDGVLAYVLQKSPGGQSIPATPAPTKFFKQLPQKLGTPGHHIHSFSFTPSCASNSSFLLQAPCVPLHMSAFGLLGM